MLFVRRFSFTSHAAAEAEAAADLIAVWGRASACMEALCFLPSFLTPFARSFTTCLSPTSAAACRISIGSATTHRSALLAALLSSLPFALLSIYGNSGMDGTMERGESETAMKAPACRSSLFFLPLFRNQVLEGTFHCSRDYESLRKLCLSSDGKVTGKMFPLCVPLTSANRSEGGSFHSRYKSTDECVQQNYSLSF